MHVLQGSTDLDVLIGKFFETFLCSCLLVSGIGASWALARVDENTSRVAARKIANTRYVFMGDTVLNKTSNNYLARPSFRNDHRNVVMLLVRTVGPNYFNNGYKKQ